jgi:1-deoxy-D-xylulose-5-phosphate synthase
MVVMAPADKEDFESMMGLAAQLEGPCSMRYPRDAAPTRSAALPFSPVQTGRAEVWQKGDDVALIALGSMSYPALHAAQILLSENIHATVVNARFAKPLDESLIVDLYKRCRAVVTIEEGVLKGGFGSAVLEALAADGCLSACPKPIVTLGLPNDFVTFDKRAALLERYKLTPLGIAEAGRRILKGLPRG